MKNMRDIQVRDIHEGNVQPQPRLGGLDESSRLQLYAAGRVKKVGSGTVFTSPNKTGAWYLVMDGQVAVTGITSPSEDASMAILTEGAWFRDSFGHLAATAPSTVMEFGPTAFENLPAKVQLQAYASLAGTLNEINLNQESGQGNFIQEQDRSRSLLERMNTQHDALLRTPPIEEFLNGVPALPPSVSLMVQSNEEISMKEVVQEVKQDPGLASLVLKIANSAAVQRGTEIADLQRACLHLGYLKVCQLVVQNAVGSIINTGDEMKELQDHAALIAATSYEIALTAFKKDSQVAATIGLLHHVGTQGLAVFRKKDPQNAWLADVIDPAQFGARLLEVWNLPARICQAVALQEVPDLLPPDSLDPKHHLDVAVLATAHACADYFMNGEDYVPGPFAEDYFALLKLPHKTVADFCDRWLRPRLLLRVSENLKSKLAEQAETDPEPVAQEA